jgi:hypothetical protein
MTSNQRRPGFRLPWTSDEEAAAAAGAEAGVNGNGPADHADAVEASVAPAATEAGAATAPAAPTHAPAAPTHAPAAPSAREAPSGFMRDLVSAMRRVAEENRQASLADLRTKSEERVRALEGETGERARELRERAESDIAGVGDWSRSEVARIEQEAEQRVVARRAQLDQQLAAEATRSEAEAQALRDRVAAYEQELDAYHARLSDIADPAAFAAAAKTMPPQPKLDDPLVVSAAPAPELVTAAPVAATAAPAVEEAQEPVAAGQADDDEPAVPEPATTGDGQAAEASAPAEPAEPAVPAQQAESAEAAAPPAAAPQAAASAAPVADAASQGTTATEVMVKGLGSFGAITGFRQSLASVDGVDGVSLSLGPTGEFVFRAIHAPNFDIAGAIASLEGDAATIEARPEGGLRVTLDRSR